MKVVKTFLSVFTENRLHMSSAALSYYLTMTAFPLLICLYTMLGNGYDSIIRLTRILSGILAPEIIDLIEDFLSYVSSNESSAMLIAGLILLLSYASAAIRSIHTSISSMQGGCRYEGWGRYLASIAFSLVFLAVIYFAVVVMLTGRKFIDFINSLLPWMSISRAWVLLRFIILALIFYCVIRGIYEAPKREEDSYSTLPGALLSTFAVLLVTLLFSVFLSRSSNYPLVYGSLASIILLMLWLYFSCNVIYCGAAINILIRDMK